MEVADSHMLEQNFTPSSHADIDMSADYYDEEYMMHDANPTTDVVDDEEIYDAEIEEQTGHTEVEMDDYTDQLAGDNETHMGTFVPADDTATDVIVEDVHIASSPAVSGTPRALSPDAAHPILQHVAGADPVINVTASSGPLSNHSPQSAATLVGDSDPAHLEQIDEKFDHPLHEVIDLTATNDEPLLTTNDVVDLTEDDGAQGDSELAQAELYEEEEEEEEDTPTITGSVDHRSPVTNEVTEAVERQADLAAVNGASESSATRVHGSEPAEQYDHPDNALHSPVEEAIVLNQQVRDDAADTMEPSPPVRLLYDDKASGTNKTFDIFASIEPLSDGAEVLFADNRTLFYDPLSVFFLRLRETEYFSHSDWQESEMGITLELGNRQLTITEDHKQTDNISLFNLYFVWSGLGLESPLQLKLQRDPNRFSVQYAKLIDHLEQRDIHGGTAEEIHEVQQHEDQVTENDYVSDHHEGEHSPLPTAQSRQLILHIVAAGDRTASDGVTQKALPEFHDTARARASGRDRDNHEAQDARSDANAAEAFEEANGQQGVGDEDDDGGSLSNSRLSDGDQRAGNAQIDAQAENIPIPASPIGEAGHGEPADDQEGDGDLYDEYEEDYADEGDASVSTPVQRGEPVLASDKEYDEYEESEGENDLAPNAKNGNDDGVEGTDGQDEGPQTYYDGYDDVNEAGDNEESGDESPQQASADLQRTELSIQTTSPPLSPSRQHLKRNLDDLENDSQEKFDSTASLVPLMDTKRPKHA
ncbi:mediator of RNA polymerase II transcription subunit [Ceratobasidium sp. AG-Ba]|nr:mediator of RNA polymerase II transcription subunit [Ceratobasidium sp. AG-Ba]